MLEETCVRCLVDRRRGVVAAATSSAGPKRLRGVASCGTILDHLLGYLDLLHRHLSFSQDLEVLHFEEEEVSKTVVKDFLQHREPLHRQSSAFLEPVAHFHTYPLLLLGLQHLDLAMPF